MALEYRIAVWLRGLRLPPARNRAAGSAPLAICRRVAAGQPVSPNEALSAASFASSGWFWAAIACVVVAFAVEIPLTFISDQWWVLVPPSVFFVGAAVGLLEFSAMTTRARYFRWRQLRSGGKQMVLSGRFDFWIALMAGVFLGGVASLVGLANA